MKSSTKIVPEEANKHYKLEDVSLLDDKQVIVDIIRHFEMYQLPRLELLEEYYAFRNDYINNRPPRRNPEKADHRASHGFALTITGFHVSYLTGIPIRVESEDEKVTEFIQNFNELNDIDAHHADLATDLSKYGRAFELLHRGDETRVYLSNPYWTIVIYDESIEFNPIAALRFPKVQRENGMKYSITLYTHDTVTRYRPCELIAEDMIEEDITMHAFGQVPIVEYSHNRFRVGDYEPVLTEIDLYDSAQSDSANYMTDTNDALLVISGDFKAASVEYNRDVDALLLESGEDSQGRQTGLDAKYVYKQYDVAGTEAYKKRIERDIYKFSKTPDLTAENFVGNQSGEAAKFQMIAPEQARSLKERIMVKGFNRRYRMVSELANTIREFTDDIGRLKYTFTPNLPESIAEDLNAFVNAGGRVSNKTLLSQLPFVNDVNEELKNIEEEDNNWLPTDATREA